VRQTSVGRTFSYAKYVLQRTTQQPILRSIRDKDIMTYLEVCTLCRGLAQLRYHIKLSPHEPLNRFYGYILGTNSSFDQMIKCREKALNNAFACW
jgi:hypothetical protein